MRNRRLLRRLDVASPRPDRVVARAGHTRADPFAAALTRVDSALAGRAYAAYGGIYIVCSLAWLVLVERTMPRASDLLGSAVCLAGAAIILLGVRAAAA
jgi:drug/metabolite transporter superfamily protein YnfA